MNEVALKSMRDNAINQENAKVNNGILVASQLSAQSTRALVDFIKPTFDEYSVETRQQNDQLITTIHAFGRVIEVIAAEISDVIDEVDEIKKERKEKNQALIGVISPSKSNEVVQTEPTPEVKPMLIANESVKAIADALVPYKDEVTKQLTVITNNSKELVQYQAKQAANDKENKINALVKKDSPVKKGPIVKNKVGGGLDLKGLLKNLMPLLKKFLSPITWITTIIAEVLPWVIIIGAFIVGFFKEASLKIKAYALAALGVFVFLWRALTGHFLHDIKLIGKFIWGALKWAWGVIKAFFGWIKSAKVTEHVANMKNALAEKARNAWAWTKDKALFVYKKTLALKEFLLAKARNAWAFAKEKAMFLFKKGLALKDWALSKIRHTTKLGLMAKDSALSTASHTAKMGNALKEFGMSVVEHVMRIGNYIKEFAMSVLEHVMKIGNVIKDFAMSVIRHGADMARIAYALACELGKFIKEMIVTGLKLIHAVALFIADMARVVFQIAMAAMQYILIAAAIVAIVALVGLVLYGLVKVIMMIVPMIVGAITSFFKAAWEVIKDIIKTLADFLVPIGKAIIEFLADLNPGIIIIKLIKGLFSAIKDLFTGDNDEVEGEASEQSSSVAKNGISEGEYKYMEQQKMNLFDSKMNQVLRQMKAIKIATTLGTLASTVTAKFFGVNPQNGQTAPQGTSSFAQTVATDSSNVKDQIAKNNKDENYNEVLDDIKKLLVAIRDKEIVVNTGEKKTGLFSLFG